jgi:hypothetical protein
VKRKRTDETSEANDKRLSEKWICDLCHVNTSGEISFVEHCAGYLHQSNVADMKWAMETAEPTMIATAELYRDHNPTAWNCSICQVKCSGELDLKNHLNGRRHQENLGALWRESEENEGKSGSQEANLYEKKEPHLVDMNQRPTSGWTCSICQANCTSDSDLENHLRGRRHQQNVKAQLVDGNSTTVANSR